MKAFASWLVVALAASVAVDTGVLGTSAVAQGAPHKPGDDKAPPKDEKKKDEPKPDAKDARKGAEVAWVTDYEKALVTAKKEKKLVLADFTGSDWCGWCQKLKAEVFDTKEFKDWAKKNVVLLELDFPHNHELDKDLKKQNEGLAKKHKIEGFPTILFFNAKGDVIGKMGYEAGGPSVWTKKADKILAKG